MITRRKPILRKTPIRRVSRVRAAQLREYTKLRKEFLAAHPYCQAHMIARRLDEAEIIKAGGFYWRTNAAGVKYAAIVPRSEEIHHKAKRRKETLNDISKWLAVSRIAHIYIETHLGWARENGLAEKF